MYNAQISMSSVVATEFKMELKLIQVFAKV